MHTQPQYRLRSANRPTTPIRPEDLGERTQFWTVMCPCAKSKICGEELHRHRLVHNSTAACTHTLPFPHTVRLGDGRTLRATGSAGSFVTAWLLEPTVNSTCVLAVTASWSVRVYVAARETHGRVCPLCYLLPVTVGVGTRGPLIIIVSSCPSQRGARLWWLVDETGTRINSTRRTHTSAPKEKTRRTNKSVLRAALRPWFSP